MAKNNNTVLTNAAAQVDQVFAQIGSEFDKMNKKAIPALVEIAEEIKDTAVEYAPLQTGALRESGRTRVVKRGGKNDNYFTIVDISFGGAQNPVQPTDNAPFGIVDYATIVHEDLSKSYTIGGPKFLEKAVKEHADRVSAELAAKLKNK